MGDDYGNGIAVDASGNAYVTGDTASWDFPVTAGAAQTTLGGGIDAFVAKLNSDGSVLSYATYLGGGLLDSGAGIAVGPSGNAYVTGQTSSGIFPTTVGAFQTAAAPAAVSEAFAAELDSTGRRLIYS